MSSENQDASNPACRADLPAQPPLHRAARLGDHAEIRRLLAAGEDANAVFDMREDPSGYPVPVSPLMVAAGSSDGASLETIELLLEHGADPRQLLRGRSAADLACQGLRWGDRSGGDAPRLKRLLQAGSPLHLQGKQGGRLIAAVAGSGDIERLKMLLDLGANPHAQWEPDPAQQARYEQDKLPYVPAPYPHEIPLFQAVQSGNPECVRLLLQAGAHPRQTDNSGRTAIFHADSQEVLRVLLATGLSLEDRNVYGWTPLVTALSEEPPLACRRVRALIAAGADVNATHDRGYTVFMSAASSISRDPQVMQILLDAGADPHAVTELGYNALHAAIDVNGEANYEPSVRATFEMLKRLGVNLEHRNKSGETPLARAMGAGTAIEVQVLLEMGADPNARCRGCCSLSAEPLLFNAIGDPEKVELLLRYSADPGVRNASGLSPADCARQGMLEVQQRRWGYPHDNEEWVERYQRCIALLEQAGGTH